MNDQANQDGIDLPDRGVKMVMDIWTKQSVFPLVTVKRSPERDFVTVSQEPYKHRDKDYSWWIPLKYVIIPFTETEANLRIYGTPIVKQVWLGKDTQSLKIILTENVGSDIKISVLDNDESNI